MTKGTKTYQWCIALLLCLVQTAGIAMYGQDRPRAAAKRQQKELADTLRKIPQIVPDSLDALSDPILQRVSTADSLAVADSIAAETKAFVGDDLRPHPASARYACGQSE